MELVGSSQGVAVASYLRALSSRGVSVQFDDHMVVGDLCREGLDRKDEVVVSHWIVFIL